MYVKDTPVPTTAGYDQMMAEKLSRMGYSAATCATAQILVSMEMRVTGDNEETGRVMLSIDGKNGSRKGHYDNTITAADFHQNHERVIQSMGLGLAGVMAQIDPEYPKKVSQVSGVQPHSTSQRTICISYHFFMEDKELPLGDQFNHLLDKFFTDSGYRPTTCEEAQIKLTGDMRFTGDPPSRASILFTAKSAGRSEQYSMEFTGDEWRNNRATIMTQMSLGMLVVMDRIEPGYLTKYGEWVQKQVESPEK
jgi:hypothetical protein